MYKTDQPNEKFGQRGTDLLRSIDKLAKRMEGDDDFMFIDTDLAPDSEEEIEIADYEEAQAYLDKHKRQLNLLNHEPYWEEHLFKIMCIKAALEDFSNPSTDRKKVATCVLGVHPARTNEKIITERSKRLAKLQSQPGEEKILSSKEVEDRGREIIAWAGKIVPGQVILSPEFEDAALLDPLEGVNIEFVDNPKVLWVGGFYTKDRQPGIMVNTSTHHQYTEGRVAAVGIHEVSHAYHAALKRWAVAHKLFSRFFATTTTGGEVLPSEVFAHGIEQRLLRTMGYTYQALLHDISEQVWNNAQFRIDNGAPDKEVIEYVKKRPHPQAPEMVKKSVPIRREDKITRIYVHSYEPALQGVRRILKLPDEQQKQAFGNVAAAPYSLTI